MQWTSNFLLAALVSQPLSLTSENLSHLNLQSTKYKLKTYNLIWLTFVNYKIKHKKSFERDHSSSFPAMQFWNAVSFQYKHLYGNINSNLLWNHRRRQQILVCNIWKATFHSSCTNFCNWLYFSKTEWNTHLFSLFIYRFFEQPFCILYSTNLSIL